MISINEYTLRSNARWNLIPVFFSPEPAQTDCSYQHYQHWLMSQATVGRYATKCSRRCLPSFPPHFDPYDDHRTVTGFVVCSSSSSSRLAVSHYLSLVCHLQPALERTRPDSLSRTRQPSGDDKWCILIWSWLQILPLSLSPQTTLQWLHTTGLQRWEAQNRANRNNF